MSIFKELEELYFEIDTEYARQEFDARAKGLKKKEQQLSRKRHLITHNSSISRIHGTGSLKGIRLPTCCAATN